MTFDLVGGFGFFGLRHDDIDIALYAREYEWFTLLELYEKEYVNRKMGTRRKELGGSGGSGPKPSFLARSISTPPHLQLYTTCNH